MWKSLILQFVALLLAGAAALISYSLLQKHVGAKPPAWFDEGCPVHAEKGRANCAAVLASPYGSATVWLPLGGRQKVPVAFLGWAYYSALMVWFIGVGRATPTRRWWMLVGAIVLAAGLASSAYYLYVMFSKLDHWCTWCLVTHLLNLGIALCMVLMWPRKAKPVSDESAARANTKVPHRAAEPESDTQQGPPAHPSWRTVLISLLAMLLVVSMEHQMLQGATRFAELQSAKSNADQCMANIQRLMGDSERLARLWDVSETKTVNIRADDPIRSRAKQGQVVWDLVVFSDFECPTCKRTATFIEQNLLPLFDQGLRVTYKHFPINKDCNGSVSSTFHPNACVAAQIAEAARLQGGGEAFWAVHDLLFSKQVDGAGLAGLNPQAIAKEAGLDPQRLVTDMASPIVAQRLKEDIDEAVRCELRATPFLMLNGKPVDGLSAKDQNFWDKIADRYWKQAGIPRPDSAKLKAAPTATPSNPAKPNAP